MSKRANPAAVGIFVVVALALVVVGLVTLGSFQLFKHELPFVMFFEGDLGGLDVGAPVQIRGVKIGTVSRIRLFPNTPKIGVYVNIDPTLLPRGSRVGQGGAVEELIKGGLRAQLKTQSLLTGQLLVYLDLFPGTPIVLVHLDPDVREIPTVPTTLERLQARLESFLSKIEKIPFDQLMTSVTETLDSTKSLIRSPEVKHAIVAAGTALQSADSALKEVERGVKELERKIDTVADGTDVTLADTRALIADTRKVLARLDAQIEPLSTSIQGTSDSARQTLSSVERAVDGNSRTGYELTRALRDVADAARSLKALADYLERHPEALLRGKGGPESK
ncbi:MAG TPA: MlaD family protein [Candidatus Bathyarchaeia archaeon]|nr:MlaD family protein [Candidatus Bathyarchaeia archaeon]